MKLAVDEFLKQAVYFDIMMANAACGVMNGHMFETFMVLDKVEGKNVE